MPVGTPADAPAIDLTWLGSFEVADVLYEAEEPIVFTVKVDNARTLIAYLADHNAEGRWLVVSPCGTGTIRQLQAGTLLVRDAITTSWMWLVQVGFDGKPKAAWSVDVSKIPEGHLPDPELPLLPEHDAVLSTKAVGSQIVLGEMPASAIAFVAGATRHAVKSLLDFVLERESEGRPPDEIRVLYDLPVTRFAFNSFALSFGGPKRLFTDPAMEKVSSLIQSGVEWASGADDSPSPGTTDDERGAVLHSVLVLTPPATGPIERVEVSGQWISRGRAVLTRASRKRVRSEIKKMQSEHVVRLEGRIGEMDRDKLTFILRNAGSADTRCSFSSDDYDDVFDAFESQVTVAVVGVERAGRLYVASGGIEQRLAGA